MSFRRWIGREVDAGEGARSWTMGFQRTLGLGAFAFPEWWLMGPI